MMIERDALIDELFELSHDLGKYIRLPLSFLPAGAPPAEVRAAVERALFETRSGPGGVRPAREVWRAFQAEAGDALEHLPSYAALCDAVARALAWEELAAGEGGLDREAVTADLSAVQPAVRAVIAEVKRG